MRQTFFNFRFIRLHENGKPNQHLEWAVCNVQHAVCSNPNYSDPLIAMIGAFLFRFLFPFKAIMNYDNDEGRIELTRASMRSTLQTFISLLHYVDFLFSCFDNMQ